MAYLPQQERSSLVEKIKELEAEIVNLKRWDAEKERYKLIEVGSGAYAYVITSEAQGSEPEHLLCPTCYEHAKKVCTPSSTAGGPAWNQRR